MLLQLVVHRTLRELSLPATGGLAAILRVGTCARMRLSLGACAALAALAAAVCVSPALAAAAVRDDRLEARAATQWAEACKAHGRSPEVPAVVRENCRAVLDEDAGGARPPRFWDVNGGGDASVQGFSDRPSYVAGQSVRIRVRFRPELLADALYGPANGTLDGYSLRADVWRFGHYGGMGARRIATVKAGAAALDTAASQPACLRDEATLLVDCGVWEETLRWRVPDGAVSGLFAARLVLTPPGWEQSAGIPAARRPVSSSWRVDNAQSPPSPQFANADHDYKAPPPCGVVGSPGGPHANSSCRASRLRNALSARRLDAAAGDASAVSREALVEPAASLVFFVVRPAPGERRALVAQVSDVTWRAYNYYEGPNVYGMAPDARHRFNLTGRWADPAVRAHKVSLNAPLVVRDLRGVNAPLGVDLPAIAWLEASGFDVGYVSGVDTHCRGGRLLPSDPHSLGAQAIVSLGHDEYWSGRQRLAVEAARDEGVSLAFWSGNEAYWRLRWEPGLLGSAPWEELEEARPGAGGDPAARVRELPLEAQTRCNPRTLVVYKESQADGKLDPREDEWTGTFRDASAHNPVAPGRGQSEAALTGLMWGVNAYRADSMEVPHPLAQLRQWRGTEAAQALQGPWQRAVLMRGLLGHEWDVDADTAARPAGLVSMSLTSLHNVLHAVDNGATFDTASADHRMVAFRSRGGCGRALVWATGTVQWSFGLSALHDRPTAAPTFAESDVNARVGVDQQGPDSSVQQLTVGMLADMGLQPAAAGAFLPPGIATRRPSTDEAAPRSEVLAAELVAAGGADEVAEVEALPPADGAEPQPVHGLRARVRAAVALARSGRLSFTVLPHAAVVVKAADAGGGRVAGVEASVDGGVRWHPARPAWEVRRQGVCGGEQAGNGRLWPRAPLPPSVCSVLTQCEAEDTAGDGCWVAHVLLSELDDEELDRVTVSGARARAVDDSYNLEGARCGEA